MGKTLSSKSWHIGTTLSHKVTENGKWRMHYYFSLNVDLYDINMNHFDLPIGYSGESSYNNLLTNDRIAYNIIGDFSLNSKGKTAFTNSINQSFSLSYSLPRGKALKFELGFRHLPFATKHVNYFELDLEYIEFNEERTALLYTSSTRQKFSIYTGGYYSNLTFTFRPFRSKRDNSE